jgi:hypothetical protein
VSAGPDAVALGAAVLAEDGAPRPALS